MNEENMNNEGLENQEPQNQEPQNQNPSVPQINFPRANPLNSFAGHPALGLNRRTNQNNENEAGKGEQNKKSSDPNAKNNNDMPGAKKDEPKKTDGNNMPGAKKNDPKNDPAGMPGRKKSDSQDNSGAMPGRKKDDSKKKKDDKNKKDKSNIKKPGERKNNNPLSRFNPLNRLGLGKKKESQKEGTAENIAKGAGNKLAQAFAKLPLVVKIKVAATISIVLFLAIALLILITILGGTTAAVVAASCNNTDYDVNGADTTKFLCSMASPFGEKKYTVSGTSGWRVHPTEGIVKFHYGTDVYVNGNDLSVYAVQEGTIEEIKYNDGWGNTILINHGNFTTRYAHLSEFESGLEKGDKVKQGQKIGTEGTTGTSTGNHLHFELRNSQGDYLSANPFFGYSDQGYEECINPSAEPDMSTCSFEKNQESRYLGEEGFNQICGKTGSYTSSDNSGCCSSYSSSVSVGDKKGLPKILTDNFINGAIETQSKYGVPASLTLAQLILESRGEYGIGISELGYTCKNLFGIKGEGSAGSCIRTTQECNARGCYTTSAKFAKYQDHDESIMAHGELLIGKTYTRCTKDAKTADDWAKAIHKCGYATNPNYSKLLIDIMKTYNLYQYDDESVFGSGSGTCDTGESGDILDKAKDEYEKWNKASSSERSEMVKNYMEACGGGRTCNEWCAGFVSYVLKETGRTKNLKNFNCLADSYTKVKPATHNKQDSGYTPKEGDIIVFDYNEDGNGDHVAIVESVKGKTIHYIGGNQTSSKSADCWRNAITRVTTPLDSKQILEFVTIG